jgi:hypothetical protein
VSLMDPDEGRRRRDEGMDAVVRGERRAKWNQMADAIAVAWLERIPVGAEIQADDLRALITPVLGPPDHPNMWGPLMKRMASQGLIEATNRQVASAVANRHSGTQRIWIRRQP